MPVLRDPWLPLLSLFLAALYLPVILFAFTHRTGQASTGILVGLYALAGLALNLNEARPLTGESPSWAFETYAALGLAILLLVITRLFLRRSMVIWLAAAAVWIGLLSLSVINNQKLPATILATEAWRLPREGLGPLLAMLGWAIFIAGAAAGILQARGASRQPLFRNRLTYWLPVFLLVAINDILLFAGAPLPGGPLRLAATFALGYAALTHQVPDVRRFARRGLVYILTAFLITLFYLLSFSLAQFAFRLGPVPDSLLPGLGVALLLALIWTPLLGQVRRRVDGWFNVDRYDIGRTMQQYSESISHILEMERLADVAVGVILENMQVRRGFMFLVEHELDDAGRKSYRLIPIGSRQEIELAALRMVEDGPIPAYFVQEGAPLLHYDLDRLPAFRRVPLDERDWFNRLEAEVYVPIFAKGQWTGLLALGAKLSGNPFTEADLVTLSALANQSGVALENARLVDRLIRLNSELRQARYELEKSNRDLERLDQTKSDFISIASHELRTPLTVIKGYTEMLMEDTSLDPNAAGLIKGIHKGSVRLHEIMDSMFDLAQIDARTLPLHMQHVDLGALLRDVAEAQQPALQARAQSLAIDLPALPQVRADPESLRKVFHHLINNAIKFSPDKGHILITGGAAEAEDAGGEPGVEVVVSDSGVGVDPNFHEIIFSKFHQGGELDKHSTSKSGFKGSGPGLGLALSRGIVEAHGGRIWVESPGHDEARLPGSRFHVFLPLGGAGEDSALVGGSLQGSFGA